MYRNNFIDIIKIYCQSGDGGIGLIHFKKNKFISPDGGSGGKGGDILLKGNNNLSTFIHLKHKKYYYAQNGENGGINYLKGRNGKNIIIEIPIGTIVKNEYGKILFEITNNIEKKVLFLGGKGGLGNSIKNYHKSYQIGSKGVKGWIMLELKILSDIGLVGFPNVGKSTLLSVLTSAKPKISNYPFTTITPNLGIMYNDNNIPLIIADIPGIIKNASNGKGLGYYFLKHIEKNNMLLFIISADMKNPKKMYKKLLYELYKFNPILLKKKRLLIISKIDLLNCLSKKKLKKKLIGCDPYIFISSLNMIGIDIIKHKIYNIFLTKKN